MKVTVVNREVTDTIKEVDISTPALYKVGTNNYIYFSDKCDDVVMEITYDKDNWYDIFMNMSQINFVETNVACNAYKIHTLKRETEVDVEELLEVVFSKFKSFV